MFKWITNAASIWVKRLIERKSADPRCGVWPIQFGKDSFFQTCCKLHDIQYLELRYKALKLAEIGKVDLLVHSEWLDVFQEEVLQIDENFYKCIRREAYGNAWREFVAEVFRQVVLDLGWKIWKEKTLQTFEDLRGLKLFDP